jgi:transcriptional regulator, MarR family
MITTSADSKLVQKLNRLTVLDIIRCKGPISRAEISKLTNLSPTTVSYAVTNLIEDGFVIETGVGDSSGGRKPILIEFNPKGRHVISIEINRSAINGALYDLNGIMEYKIHEDLKTLNQLM